MINNLPVKTLAHKDLTIEGYSRAAVQTYWRIPELKIGFDLGRAAVVVHGHAHVVRLAHPHGPPDRPAGLRGAAADDEDGAADDLPARGGRRADAAGAAAAEPHGPRAAALHAAAGQAGRRVRAVARAGGHRLGHDPHGAVAGLRGLGAAAEAQARVPRPARRADPRSAARRHGGDQRRSAFRGWPTWATVRRPGWTPARPCSRPRC